MSVPVSVHLSVCKRVCYVCGIMSVQMLIMAQFKIWPILKRASLVQNCSAQFSICKFCLAFKMAQTAHFKIS